MKNINRLFVNGLKEVPGLAHIATNDTDILPIDYSLNSLGYRSQEFDGKSEVLFLGCSLTYGQGLPEENIWPTILANKLNLRHSSLAAKGDSVMGQVAKAFYYFEKFGNPKIIVAIFPFSRINTPYVKGRMETKNKFKRQSFEKYEYLPMVEYSEVWGAFDNYAKAPYDPQNVLTEEFVFFYENIFIDMLRQYCVSNGIKFFWSNWDPMYQKDIYNEVNSFYPKHHEGYCHIDAFDWKIPKAKVIYGREDSDDYGEYNALDCHQEYDRNHDLFYRAADRKDGHPPHWGFHKHLHVAEDFYNFMIDKL
jgi:hypothetical protein